MKTGCFADSHQRRLGVFLVLGLLGLGILGAPAAVAAKSASVSGPYKLALSVVPSKLPADGLTYPALVVSVENSSSLPVLATQTIQVYLSSAESSIASMSSEVTIQEGASFAVANVTTSNSPGSTNVTAIATGLLTASTAVTTVIPSGFPDHLAVFALPSVQLARPTSHGEVVVQVQDDLGVPAAPASALVVSLSSSDNRTAKVSNTRLTIPAGSSMGFEGYATGLVTGSASITASSSGYASGSSPIRVVTAPPLVLAVTAEPNLISPGSVGRVVVSLLDQSGDPAEAPANIQVYMTSSNLGVVQLSSGSGNSPVVITIPKDHVYAETTFVTLVDASGNATISASAHGVASGFAAVQVGQGAAPTELRLFLAPNPVPSNGASLISIGVALASGGIGTLHPAQAPSTFPVVVTASDNATGRVIERSTVQFYSGTSYTVANFTSTQLPSTAVITAAAQGYAPAQAVMVTQRPDLPIGPPPAQVVVSSIAPTLPADGGTYQGLLVSLEDSFGGPAIAPTALSVRLAFDRPGLVQLTGATDTVTIGANQSYAVVDVRTSSTVGTVNVTASASGYGSSWALLSTKALSPAKLALYVSPSPALVSKGGQQSFLAVQLQGADGSPASARASTSVILTSSGNSLFSRPQTVNIPAKSDYALVPLNATAGGSTIINAISSGLVPAATAFVASAVKLTYNLGPKSSSILAGQTTTVYYSAQVQGAPIPNATLTWSATGGSISHQQGTTDSSGSASALFVSSGAGIATITVEISSPLTGKANSTTNVFVVAPKAPPSLLSRIFSYLPYIGAAAAAAVIVAFILIRRRRGGGSEDEEGFSMGESPGPAEALGPISRW